LAIYAGFSALGLCAVSGTVPTGKAEATAMAAAKGIVRCAWSEGVDPAYERYHDEEWGVPVHDDVVHFEFLLLEGAQAGLSWWTILRKREAYRRAFSGFDAAKVARFTPRTVEKLLADPGIVRNRQKIEAAVVNARAFLAIQGEFGSFDRYVWEFVGGEPIVNRWRDQADVPATSKESDALSKDLKHRGFKFVGSTIVYAHMQATGLVNDHLVGCFRHRECSSRSLAGPRTRAARRLE
jgi:DNA-3-methyladenine glycosylase I